MAKMFNYMAITISIWILLTIMGISLSGTFIISKMGMGSPEALANFQNSQAYLAVLAALATLTIGAVIIGIFTKTISAIPATAALASLIFLALVMDMVQLINLVSEVWMKNVLWFFVSIYVGGYIIAAYDWVRGID